MLTIYKVKQGCIMLFRHFFQLTLSMSLLVPNLLMAQNLTNSSKLNTFQLSQIPALDNKKPISIVAEQGFLSEHLRTSLLPRFSEHTGVKVNLMPMPLDDMYDKQNKALINGEGKFDLLSMEAGWSKEWASNGFTLPLNSLAKQYDYQGEQGMKMHLAPFYKNLLHILSYQGQYHSIPYNNYTMGNHYRLDLFEHSEEKIAFQNQYGYSLAPPNSIKSLIDVSRFFTRKKGEFLAGKRLTRDFYGLTLMSGNRPHINDEFSSLLWGVGGAWLRPIYNETGDIALFNVEANSKEALYVARSYLQLLEFAVPATKHHAFLESANAIANSQAAMYPFAYNNLWAVSAQVEKNFPGAKLGISTTPLGKPYTGAYALAVAYDSKNPEAAYWLLKYITSFEGQRAYAKGGGNPSRADVALLDEFNTKSAFAVSGSFQQNHLDNLAWGDQVLKLGHFTSTAMGKIYPELMRTSYLIRSRQASPEDALDQLQQKIFELQNYHGEAAAFNKTKEAHE
ncbi:transporter, putative [Marinomonas sp. MED121]|uniref:extracellular solute-binding protein n=1 Tax=Marinomonas sp. MED121 TaxID=314277 RepID=UPI0000690A99|nr:extracellular solute-binding protein [Marinomonas sp. MED121]EAQ66062.1 transporter, putative [Marinomonas sp. MED121]